MAREKKGKEEISGWIGGALQWPAFEFLHYQQKEILVQVCVQGIYPKKIKNKNPIQAIRC